MVKLLILYKCCKHEESEHMCTYMYSGWSGFPDFLLYIISVFLQFLLESSDQVQHIKYMEFSIVAELSKYTTGNTELRKCQTYLVLKLHVHKFAKEESEKL